MIETAKYPVEIFYSAEDAGFIAIAPDLPGCSAFGESRAEAADEIVSAMVAWLCASLKAGNPIPEPSARSVGEGVDTPSRQHLKETSHDPL